MESSKVEQPAEYSPTNATDISASVDSPSIVSGVTLSKQVELYPDVSDEDRVTVGVEATGSDSISVESLTAGLSASLEGNKIVISADPATFSDTVTGSVSVKVTRSTTGAPASGEEESSAAESKEESQEEASSQEDKESEEVKESESGSSETPSSEEASRNGSSEASSSEEASSKKSSSKESSSEASSSKESSSKESSSKESESETPSSDSENTEEVEVTITVIIHGYNEQLKDNEGHELFRDDSGANAATIGDYNGTKVFYFMSKAAGETTYKGWHTIGGYQYYFDKNGKKVTGIQVIRGIKYNFGTDGALITSGLGIDVSKWQGDIDWAAVKPAISFAIIRAGYRGSEGGLAVDPCALANLKGCNANGIRCGLYFYSIAMNRAQAVEEASLALDVARKGKIDLPIFIDMEDSRQRDLPDSTKDEIVMAFCQTIRSQGYSAGLYASKNWIETYLTPSKYGSITMWVAQYNVRCDYSGHYDIWQYSSNGDVPGINTKVDMNEGSF